MVIAIHSPLILEGVVERKISFLHFHRRLIVVCFSLSVTLYSAPHPIQFGTIMLRPPHQYS